MGWRDEAELLLQPQSGFFSCKSKLIKKVNDSAFTEYPYPHAERCRTRPVLWEDPWEFEQQIHDYRWRQSDVWILQVSKLVLFVLNPYQPGLGMSPATKNIQPTVAF